MNGLTAPTEPFAWRQIYRQALFETDRSQICARILEAEQALKHREHELFCQQHDKVEREAVINALNALRALRRCLGIERTAMAA